jgi:hypothetical protein
VQEFRQYVGSVVNASEEQRLANRKAELDRRAERLAREYAEYNVEVERYYWRSCARQTNTGLYLPEQPVFNNGTQLPPAPQAQQFPTVQQYSWPQAPVLFDAPSVQQPAQFGVPRERSLIVPGNPAYGRGW